MMNVWIDFLQAFEMARIIAHEAVKLTQENLRVFARMHDQLAVRFRAGRGVLARGAHSVAQARAHVDQSGKHFIRMIDPPRRLQRPFDHVVQPRGHQQDKQQRHARSDRHALDNGEFHNNSPADMKLLDQRSPRVLRRNSIHKPNPP